MTSPEPGCDVPRNHHIPNELIRGDIDDSCLSMAQSSAQSEDEIAGSLRPSRDDFVLLKIFMNQHRTESVDLHCQAMIRLAANEW
ncbi:MAG: hypothetical protein WBW04_03375, partial [Nitrolancea sp.]